MFMVSNDSATTYMTRTDGSQYIPRRLKRLTGIKYFYYKCMLCIIFGLSIHRHNSTEKISGAFIHLKLIQKKRKNDGSEMIFAKN